MAKSKKLTKGTKLMKAKKLEKTQTLTTFSELSIPKGTDGANPK